MFFKAQKKYGTDDDKTAQDINVLLNRLKYLDEENNLENFYGDSKQPAREQTVTHPLFQPLLDVTIGSIQTKQAIVDKLNALNKTAQQQLYEAMVAKKYLSTYVTHETFTKMLEQTERNQSRGYRPS